MANKLRTTALFWSLNTLSVVLIFAIIIYPNFYFGLTPQQNVIMVCVSGLIATANLLVCIKTKDLTDLLPLIVPVIFYTLLYLANIV